MWPYYPDLLARNVPRYTSFPTAVEFHAGVAGAEFLEAISQVEASTPISLYVHIPYCQQICWYCGCNTGAAGKSQRLSSYLAALESEIALIAEKLGKRGRVTNIAFGGGSPNAIAPVEFVRLVDRIVTMFSCDQPNISIELDPRIFSAEWAKTLAHCGVSRVSLGVQSFSEEIQKAIGRVQPAKMIEECMQLLRDEGITAVNFDLMYGLPGQNSNDLEETLETAIKLAPSRIALFGYAHMPQIFPRQRRIDSSNLPGSEERFAMAQLGYRLLTDAGYCAVGFDHFARPDDSLAIAAAQGRLHRNFQGFTDDECGSMIGLGASAISNFPNYIIQNEKSPGQYRMQALAQTVTAARGIERSPDDKMRGLFIENLLCSGNSGPLPADLLEGVEAGLRTFAERKLVRMDGSSVIIEAAGLPYARAIASLMDKYRQTDSKQFSLAV
ncbi:MAG: oxygen-independent coproporphyrinogen III oxidase [Sphingorhabdus sp.]